MSASSLTSMTSVEVFSLRGHLATQRLRSRLHPAVCRNCSKGNRVHATTLFCQLMKLNMLERDR
jgi:hypothetical protein